MEFKSNKHVKKEMNKLLSDILQNGHTGGGHKSYSESDAMNMVNSAIHYVSSMYNDKNIRMQKELDNITMLYNQIIIENEMLKQLCDTHTKTNFSNSRDGSGVSSGFGNGISSGFGNGISSGFGNGISSGFGNGISSGFGNGISSGFGDGISSGFGDGISSGFGDGISSGFGNGLSSGFGNGLSN